MVKATVGGVGVEIWFTPSFNIKTDSKEFELILRHAEYEVFDPWRMKLRTVKATKGEREAYMVLEHLRLMVPELAVTFKETPELPSSVDQGTEENPIQE